MKRIVLVIGLLSLFGACGNGSDIEETQQPLTCRGWPAAHGVATIGAENAHWYDAAMNLVSLVPSTPSTVSWSTTQVTRNYSGGVGNFAFHCTMPYETFAMNSPVPAVPGGLTGCYTALRNTGGNCEWDSGTWAVVPKQYFMYPLAAGGYMEYGALFKKVNVTGQVYRIDLNFPELTGGHFN